MVQQLDATDRCTEQSPLGQTFRLRLENGLEAADRTRFRRIAWQRARSGLPILLLGAPVVGWHLLLVSPDGVHVGVQALAWLAFILNVGVHLDSGLLSYLGLQMLPGTVGLLLLVLVTFTLLTGSRDET